MYIYVYIYWAPGRDPGPGPVGWAGSGPLGWDQGQWGWAKASGPGPLVFPNGRSLGKRKPVSVVKLTLMGKSVGNEYN